MGYKEIFTEEQILDIENATLGVMKRKRGDFKDPLWTDFNFVYNALPYFEYGDDFWLWDEFISETWYGNMLIVCDIIKNLRDAHNYIGVESVLKRIPEQAWYEQSFMFLHNVMCADISALEYAPKELLTDEVILAAITQVPHQADFCEEEYILGYKTIIECTPAHLWKNKDFTEKFKEEMCNVFTYVNRMDDLNEILSVIDSKTK
jgi:hypothetical protein